MTDILREMNAKLKSILPVGIFCCATLVDINFRKRQIRVWNGGLPECYLYSAKTLTYKPVVSRHLPLGVLASKDFVDDCITYPMALGDRLYIWSDGIHEARNPQGEMFGEERLQKVFENNAQPEELYDEILRRVQGFIGQGEKNDDLSLIEILMAEPHQVNAVAAEAERRNQSTLAEWGMSFDIQPASFRVFDPLPLLLNILVEVPGLRGHSGTLYTIISELYSNALEHGVLALDSSLKETQEGFAAYYQQRQKRLDEVGDGFIRLHLRHNTTDIGGMLTIRVEDSGAGFQGAKDRLQDLPDTKHYGGRGLALVDKLCDAVRYLGNGNEVEAVFSWRNDE